MKECVDEGTLQAWFDGEVEPEVTASIASHLASCRACTQAARVVESESLLLSDALEAEFAESIPTERLRNQVEAAITPHRTANPVRSWPSARIASLKPSRNLFFPAPQRALSYAGLAAIILSTILGVIYLQRGKVTPVARNESTNTPTTPPPEAASPGPGPTKTPKSDGSNEAPRRLVARKSPNQNATTGGILPRERQYLRTIAILDATLKSERPMRPSLLVEYEHNVALLNQAIQMTRDAARKNPKDPQAAQFMFTAYQSKIDLLNQVADARRFNNHD